MTLPARRLADPATSRAVLVGTHAYTVLPDLPGVRRNLAELARLLRDPRHWGLPADHCVVVGQPDSAGAVLDALSRAAAEAEDTLVVYFAGHGLVDHLDDSLHLALPDTRPERLYTALRFDDVRRVLRDPGTRAPRKVLIMDCCWSGRAMSGAMSDRDRAAHVAVVGTSVLTATAETRRAAAPPDEEFTAFTGELIALIGEGVEDGSDLVDMETLYLALHRRLAARGRELPQQSNRNTAARICVLRNAAWVPAEGASEIPAVVPAEVPAPRASGAAPVEPDGAPVDSLAAGFARVVEAVTAAFGPGDASRPAVDRPGWAHYRTVNTLLLDLAPDLRPGVRIGLRLVKEIAEGTSDGTVTAMLLADAMARHCRTVLGWGTVEPLALIRDLVARVETVRARLRSSAAPVERDEQLLALVATATDDPVARTVTEAYRRIGPDGRVTVNAGPGTSWRVTSVGSTAQIHVNPSTRDRVDHEVALLRKGVAVARAGYHHGVLPGGGAAYLALREDLGEDGPARTVLSAALAAPALRLTGYGEAGPPLGDLTAHAVLGRSYDVVRGDYTPAGFDRRPLDAALVLDHALARAVETVVSLLLPLPVGH